MYICTYVADDTICGGIKIDTQHQQHVDLAVQKITACSTMGGYIPRFNQQASLSGCLTHTPFITKLYTIFVSHIPVVCDYINSCTRMRMLPVMLVMALMLKSLMMLASVMRMSKLVGALKQRHSLM